MYGLGYVVLLSLLAFACWHMSVISREHSTVQGDRVLDDGETKVQMNVIAAFVATHVAMSADDDANAASHAMHLLYKEAPQVWTSTLTGDSFLINSARDAWLPKTQSPDVTSQSCLVVLRFVADDGTTHVMMRDQFGKFRLLGDDVVDLRGFVSPVEGVK